jgi:hypothetical protein
MDDGSEATAPSESSNQTKKKKKKKKSKKNKRNGMAKGAWDAVAAVCWLGVAVAILRRHLKFRKSKSEVGYMLAFMAFGLSDFIETSGTTLLLLLFKGACLLAILACRKSIRPLYQNPAF